MMVVSPTGFFSEEEEGEVVGASRDANGGAPSDLPLSTEEACEENFIYSLRGKINQEILPSCLWSR